MKTEIQMGGWAFFISFMVYAVFSIVLFFLTSGGWSALSVVFIEGPFFLLLVLVLFCVTVTRSVRSHKTVSISRTSLWLVVGAQLIFALLNVGDCGDGGGPNVFIIKLLSPSSYCDYPGASYHPMMNLWMILGAVYALALITFLFGALRRSTEIVSESI
jgi:hypothetical protein